MTVGAMTSMTGLGIEARRGLALPVTLMTLMVAAMLSAAIAQVAVTSYKSQTVWEQRIKANWILSAGLNRAARALLTPGDPMREPLFDGRPIAWDFSGARVTLSMQRESDKIAINSEGQRLLIHRLSVILASAPAELLAYAIRRLEDARSGRITLASPEVILPLEQRFGPFADLLRHSMTAFSAPAQTAEHGSTQGRPIYRLLASLSVEKSSSGKKYLSKKTLVLILSANDQKSFKIIEGFW